MANCSLSRADALPGSVWRVRWAEGGVCPAVSGRYKRGAAAERLERLVGPGGCVRQFRSDRGGAAEGLERSVGPGRGVSGSFGTVQ